ncbi:hypothetical protein LTSEMON_4052 [Salmonella enterica subsp. enterica serovar Montevideo str. S5-403]|uniref:Uncharacterized protein n=1 Tax=Salmonella enterica subsp. enterica serovar Montevideo str. S5-403 TaxID=913242 RepID=G5Q6Z7_SALMO|nr:hypothetical protein LTSEMON_4052 [Salmonella enterica subsp. enterica serovar Montevideo str. S5-403]
MAFLGAPRGELWGDKLARRLIPRYSKTAGRKKSAPREQTLVPQTQPGDEFQSTTRKTFFTP